MLNNMTPFQAELMEHYTKERKKRAKAIAEGLATQQYGPAPQKQGGGQPNQNGANSTANGPRSPQIAQSMSQPMQMGQEPQNQTSNQIW